MAYRKVSIDFSNLPIFSENKINWSKSIGLSVKYKIEDTNYSGYIKILGIKGRKICLCIDDNNSFWTNRDSFKNGLISKQFGVKAKIYKYKVGDVINNQRILDQIIITHLCEYKDKSIENHENGYIVECLTDHYIYKKLEKDLTLNKGCPVCGQNKVIAGINDIATTNPILAKWFVDKSLTYKLSQETNKMVELCCPDCGKTFWGIPNRYKKGYPTCQCQKSNRSYPERLFSSILDQLGVEYIAQAGKKLFEWCKLYRYDFYFKIKGAEYFVELDGGLGHGKTRYYNPQVIENSIKRDTEKNLLAQKHGIEMIRIDVDYPCIDHRFEFIYNNIVDSELANLLDFSLVDIERCKTDAESSLLIEVSKLWDDEKLTQTEICKKLNISPTTVSQYLKKGRELGLNNYKEHSRKYVPHHVMKIIKVQNHDGDVICIHEGIQDFFDNVESLVGQKIGSDTIYNSLKTNLPTKSGFLFSYATQDELQDYLNIRNKGGK